MDILICIAGFQKKAQLRQHISASGQFLHPLFLDAGDVVGLPIRHHGSARWDRVDGIRGADAARQDELMGDSVDQKTQRVPRLISADLDHPLSEPDHVLGSRGVFRRGPRHSVQAVCFLFLVPCREKMHRCHLCLSFCQDPHVLCEPPGCLFDPRKFLQGVKLHGGDPGDLRKNIRQPVRLVVGVHLSLQVFQGVEHCHKHEDSDSDDKHGAKKRSLILFCHPECVQCEQFHVQSTSPGDFGVSWLSIRSNIPSRMKKTRSAISAIFALWVMISSVFL